MIVESLCSLAIVGIIVVEIIPVIIPITVDKYKQLDCKRCLEGGLDQHVLLRRVEIEPHVKLECVAQVLLLR